MPTQYRVDPMLGEPPLMTRREEIPLDRGGRYTGWWVAAVVAVVSIVGLVFIIQNASNTNLQAARQAGRSEAMIDNALAQSQAAAVSANQSAVDANASLASASRAAAVSANREAEQAPMNTETAAANAQDAGRDAVTMAPAQ
jgi:hypothetical protein